MDWIEDIRKQRRVSSFPSSLRYFLPKHDPPSPESICALSFPVFGGGDVADDARTFAADGIRPSFFVLAAAAPPLLVTRLTAVRGFAGHMLQDVISRK